jgi:hypothetical protein
MPPIYYQLPVGSSIVGSVGLTPPARSALSEPDRLHQSFKPVTIYNLINYHSE